MEEDDLSVVLQRQEERDFPPHAGELAERAAATSCEATIAAQYELAITMNAKGTPLIVSDSGKAVHGFFPAMELLDRLGLAEDSVSKSAGAN